MVSKRVDPAFGLRWDLWVNMELPKKSDRISKAALADAMMMEKFSLQPPIALTLPLLNETSNKLTCASLLVLCFLA